MAALIDDAQLNIESFEVSGLLLGCGEVIFGIESFDAQINCGAGNKLLIAAGGDGSRVSGGEIFVSDIIDVFVALESVDYLGSGGDTGSPAELEAAFADIANLNANDLGSCLRAGGR